MDNGQRIMDNKVSDTLIILEKQFNQMVKS